MTTTKHCQWLLLLLLLHVCCGWPSRICQDDLPAAAKLPPFPVCPLEAPGPAGLRLESSRGQTGTRQQRKNSSMSRLKRVTSHEDL
jgi:hypothetical protein